MRALLDTHAFLWAVMADERLGSQRELVRDTANDLLVSAVVSWEISIKFSIGLIPLPEPPGTFVPSRVRRLVATLLPIEHEHTFGVQDLPMHHRDPFDRLLIAQSRSLGVPILTADRIFTQYDAEVLLIE